jgi:hypothetical protein
MLVGWSMVDAAFPFMLLDHVDDTMYAVLEIPAGNHELVSEAA